jgi:hypothetical protein
LIADERWTAYQVLAFLFITFEEETAPSVVIREAALPLCKPLLHLGVLAVWLPWPQALVVGDGSSIDGSPVLVGLDKRCEERPSLVRNESRVL